jgi:2-polyprenyl-6-methoxyphenol hydroxylase-like FAD-dependent oxidoreductase
MTARYQVIIIGGGPVGTALSVELGQRGVSCMVVDRHLSAQRIPKGQNLTQRTLEHFYFWHCVEELRAARILPSGYPIGGATAYGDLMSEYWYAPPGREVVQPYYFQANERLPQYLTEEVLRARSAEFGSVSKRFGFVAKQVEQDDDGVRVLVADEGWPYEEEWLEGDFVVGCDGGRSLVREQSGIGRDGPNFDQKMLLAVFRSREFHDGLERYPELTTYRVLDPEMQGVWQFFGRVDVGEEWFFHGPVPRDTTRDNFDFHALLERAAGFSFACEFDHLGFWELRIEVAERYRQGRAFIAGDAAHSHPPYGGFGLNTGLEDITNLGWKLAATLQGWGGEALLDSYSEERRPIFLETGEKVIAGGIERDHAFLEKYSPERDRAAFEEAWREMAAGSPGAQAYEPHYEGSSVILGPPGASCGIEGSHELRALAGHHLIPQPLSSGRNVFEELGSGFTLLALDADDAVVEAFEDAVAALGIPFKVLRDSLEQGRKEYGANFVLVRPDQFIAWAGDELPADPSALLAQVIGAA